MNSTQIRADMEAQRAYSTRISMEECSKVFVEKTIDSRIRSASTQFQTALSSELSPPQVPCLSKIKPKNMTCSTTANACVTVCLRVCVCVWCRLAVAGGSAKDHRSSGKAAKTI